MILVSIARIYFTIIVYFSQRSFVFFSTLSLTRFIFLFSFSKISTKKRSVSQNYQSLTHFETSCLCIPLISVYSIRFKSNLAVFLSHKYMARFLLPHLSSVKVLAILLGEVVIRVNNRAFAAKRSAISR